MSIRHWREAGMRCAVAAMVCAVAGGAWGGGHWWPSSPACPPSCGEMAGDGHGARILVGLGVDAISVATARFAKVKLSLRDVTIGDCRGVAREAVK